MFRSRLARSSLIATSRNVCIISHFKTKSQYVGIVGCHAVASHCMSSTVLRTQCRFSSTDSDKTGSSQLTSSPSDIEKESRDLINQFNENGESKKVLTAILTFNTIRRLHMTESNAETRKQLEAQAWRTIQTVSEKEIDDAPDLGVMIVVAAWAYFTRYWEEGRRGPAVVADGAVNPYPAEKDIPVFIDHASAIIHEQDHVVEGTEEDDLAADQGDEDQEAGGVEDQTTDSVLDERLEQKEGASGQTNKLVKPSPQNVGSAKSPSNGVRTLKKRTNKGIVPTEVVETPRAEVLDEVFE